jgi:hypothetical protein
MQLSAAIDPPYPDTVCKHGVPAFSFRHLISGKLISVLVPALVVIGINPGFYVIFIEVLANGIWYELCEGTGAQQT